MFARGTDNRICYHHSPDSDIAWNGGQIQVVAVSSSKSVGQKVGTGNIFTTYLRPNETQAVD